MKIVFRVDSSVDIGSGHYMRCLALASRLKKKAEIFFVSRNLNGSLNSLAKKYGKLIELPKTQCKQELSAYERWLTVTSEIDAAQTKEVISYLSADCLIVDHYALGESWEKIMRPYVKKIMVIDDLANRKHDCDILLDQNYYMDMHDRYTGLIPKHCRLLVGPAFALLRDGFYQIRKKRRVRTGEIKNILVFFGGVDAVNETFKTLKAIENLKRRDIQVNVVVGKNNLLKNEIEQFCAAKDNMKFFCQIDYMAQLMNEADLAIGAGGSTVWERCYLDLPSIVISVAQNQVQICEDCAKLNFIFYLGSFDRVTVNNIEKAILKMMDRRVYSSYLSSIQQMNHLFEPEKFDHFLW